MTDFASAIYYYFETLCDEFHSIWAGSLNEFVGSVLQLTVTARHKVNIACERQVADRYTTNRDRPVVVVECFLQNPLHKRLKSVRENMHPCLTPIVV